LGFRGNIVAGLMTRNHIGFRCCHCIVASICRKTPAFGGDAQPCGLQRHNSMICFGESVSQGNDANARDPLAQPSIFLLGSPTPRCAPSCSSLIRSPRRSSVRMDPKQSASGGTVRSSRLSARRETMLM
jgi:hypothetical protein